MSTTPAPRTLFQEWIDDAAVFPPGNAPAPRAWAEHVEMLSGSEGDLLGPLLIGATAAEDLARAVLVHGAPDHVSPVEVAVVGRAGTSVEDVAGAVRSLQDQVHLRVTGAEVTHGEGDWRRLVDLGLRTAVEVPRQGRNLSRALDDLGTGVAEEVGGSDTPTALVKWRTQATPAAAAPDARQLAEFLLATHERALAFKLTGGLHRAVAPGPSGDEPHGALNILVATHHLIRGSTLSELVATLELQDGEALAALLAGLTAAEVEALRARFVSFGCCGVLDPINDLARLGLITTPHTPIEES
ncbi:hypothetical protein [Ornithinimicrobium pratense]|uniref:Uncharacterized protein n=1 Tax=Ornithinimicrobium pratense TaxID=2593973 RepID=A0A5J6V6U3_9MICO|nr:hypothetical protein [Ornithinimicrobium pratense]QFG69014.1 hypothetical protein FY030_10120 [Ornithinimicrobium pratense]